MTRFEKSVCRYDEEDVICRVFDILGFPPPPAEQARACAKGILSSGFIEALALISPNAEHVRAARGRVDALLKILDAPTIEPTTDQVRAPTNVGKSLCVASGPRRVAVELHAGIGAIFHRGEIDTLISEVAPITGTGMDMRRDYLLSVVDAARDSIEQLFN